MSRRTSVTAAAVFSLSRDTNRFSFSVSHGASPPPPSIRFAAMSDATSNPPGDGDGDGDGIDAVAHAAAYDAAIPGALVLSARGALEPPRGGGDGEGRATRRCRSCGQAACVGIQPSSACPTSRPTLKCDAIELAPPPTTTTREGAPCWLVFDMAYDASATRAEIGALTRQVSMCVAANKRAKTPFLLAVAAPPGNNDDELPPASNSWRALPWESWGARVVDLDDENENENSAAASLTADARRVVYLTADSPNVLTDVAPGTALVLGGVVDHAEKPGMSLRRADALAARASGGCGRFVTARLPLGGHVRLAKNAHLPCLAVAQTLLVYREVAEERGSGGGGGGRGRDDGRAAVDERCRRRRQRRRGGGGSARGSVGRDVRARARVSMRAASEVREVVAAEGAPERRAREPAVGRHRRPRLGGVSTFGSL